MRIKLLIPLLFITSLAFSQKKEGSFSVYSYKQFFKMIEESQDSVFKLQDAIIEPNLATDLIYGIPTGSNIQPKEEQIIIDKQLDFDNVQFRKSDFQYEGNVISIGTLNSITFNKAVSFSNTYSLDLRFCTFKDEFKFRCFNGDEYLRSDRNFATVIPAANIGFYKNRFLKLSRIIYTAIENSSAIINIAENDFLRSYDSQFSNIDIGVSNALWCKINGNNFVEKGSRLILLDNIQNGYVLENIFTNGLTSLVISNNPNLELIQNQFRTPTLLDLNFGNNSTEISLGQFENSLSSSKGFRKFLDDSTLDVNKWTRDSAYIAYASKYRIINEASFNDEIEMLSKLYTYYKGKFNTKTSNEYYIKIKDLETERFEYLYSVNPSFRSYFTWKTNQFLKLFSAYGTEPSRAIVFSVYVILAFALIYLFFPNHWDSHGKNRIMDRYRFFTKYMKQDSGIHEVYLDDRQPELMASEDFKGYMQQSEKEIPKFFMATALPLYKWSVAGTKSASWLLSKVDVLKGKWSDTEPSKQGGKSILLIGAFMVALLYDIFIKMLNALMLSINTFTTLGFGEIPIKGLPRYLAIIQGFIGWFMLTIFSVSLISQLLN